MDKFFSDNRLKLAIILFVSCYLNACSWFVTSHSSLSISDREALYNVGAWVLNGRLGVKTINNSWHANIDWQHFTDKDQIQLSGPFGYGAAHILSRPGFIRITDSKGNSEISNFPERILDRRFGLVVPLSSLQYWVMGLAEPDTENTLEYDSNGFLRKLWHQGWEVQIKRYTVINGYSIPQKIRVSRDDIVLKLIVDDWCKGPCKD